MVPWFRSKPVFSAFLFIVVGLTMTGGGAWLLFLDGPAFYLFAGVGILFTGIMLLSGTPMALWFYGFVLIGTVALAVREVGFEDADLESELLAPAILGLYLLAPLALRHFGRPSPIRRREPMFQIRLAMVAPALGVVSALAVGVLGVVNSTDVSDAAATARRIANARVVYAPKYRLGYPRSADMMSSLNSHLYWRDERTDYP